MSKIKSTLQWVVGIFFCILALSMLVSGEGILGFFRGLIAAIIFAGVAILAIPTTRQRISRESGIALSTWMIVGLVFVGMMTGMIVAPDVDTDETDNITDETAPDVDDDVANGGDDTEADDDGDEAEAETDVEEGSSDSPPSEDDSSDEEVEESDSNDLGVEEDSAYESESDEDTTDDAAESAEEDDEDEAALETAEEDTTAEENDAEEDESDEDTVTTENTEDESTSDDGETGDEADESPVSAAAEVQGDIEVTAMNVQGSDPENEWIELTNVGDNTVDMSSWTVRDRYDHGVVDGRNFSPVTFPAGFTLEPDESVRIVTAPGSDTDDTIHWGYNQQNWNQDGDVIIVLDGSGDTVLEYTYGNPSD
ncbi:lamin tail domain-containing protein [Natronococcus roseus]|uniref:lamin tail domain-containing protein n=1 Tax=Natronococcus roseus TaxID=1052014 RepID=UPI00374D02D9